MSYIGTPIDTTNQFQSLQGKRFSGNGSTTAFTLDIAPSSVFDIEVFVENVRQDPNSAYSLSGTTLTFAAAPPSGTNNIYVVHQAKAVGTISPAAGTVNADSFDNTVISGHTALTSAPDDTDELLISDAGTIKRIDVSLVGGKMTPSFHAYRNGDQSISNGTYTKIQFNVETYDSDSKYDHSSNYRFTPTVAGQYFIYAGCQMKMSGAKIYSTRLAIYKNGSIYAFNQQVWADDVSYQVAQTIQKTITFDTDDYVEVYAYLEGHNTSGQVLEHSDLGIYFGGFKVIGA